MHTLAGSDRFCRGMRKETGKSCSTGETMKFAQLGREVLYIYLLSSTASLSEMCLRGVARVFAWEIPNGLSEGSGVVGDFLLNRVKFGRLLKNFHFQAVARVDVL